jgi:hypothetical protein
LITLTDERGLIYSPKSWDEILEIPGYVNGIDPAKHKLKAIIGSYHLKDIHCGLSCNAAHDKGYIAQTQSGAVTNIGHICGRKYFDVDFITFSNQHNREVTAKSHRDLLSTFSLQVEDLENEISEQRKSEYGIKWIYSISQQLINRGKECPDEVVRAVTAMIKSRSNVLQKSREATDAEIKVLELSQVKKVRKPHYIQEDIAIISGLDVLYEENDLKNLVTLEVEEKIKSFKKLNIDNLTHSELTRWAKWVSSIDSTKEKINNSMNAGINLLKSSNLSVFKEIISKRQDIEKFEKFIKKLPK